MSGHYWPPRRVTRADAVTDWRFDGAKNPNWGAILEAVADAPVNSETSCIPMLRNAALSPSDFLTAG
ncbi:hypothetical protein G1H11_17090 [Phytoactinopolyspora alkaliphila]|uniref:Uncharacterized protein n=1 Tax=Phytoactinopolyspora alkaliphila TaxID=1783498 RepID=A0A6N9YPW4_9ACTN|nr:hypothetical protein [Phytoactinopolyspora alkaliphila]NED97022.1 hypothetical protein [Phytoactinopolyspora alkaliphila]